MSHRHVDIVTINEDLAPQMIHAAGVPFSFDMDDAELDRVVASFPFDRFVVPMDGDQVVGSGGSWLYEATVPGGVCLPTAGITFVTVWPTHRRRGVLRKMMRRLLDDSRSSGEPLAALWASEATIYGRFGFGQAVEHVDWALDSRRATWRTDRPPGVARLITHEEAAEVIPPLHAAACARHGMLGRSQDLWTTVELQDEQWQRGDHGRRRIVVWRGDGGLEGYGFFRTKFAADPRTVRVDEFHALTADAYRGLAQFFTDIDLADQVIFRRRPRGDALRWLLDDSRAMTPKDVEYLWFRLLDVPEALAARTYAGSGSLVLEVNDASYDDNDARWRLDVDGGAATCSRTEAEPDIVLDVSELGALYMGGRSALPLAAAGRIRGEDAAIATLDRWFRTAVAPWSGEEF